MAGSGQAKPLEVRNFYAGKNGYVVDLAAEGDSQSTLENHVFVPPEKTRLAPYVYPMDPELPAFASFVTPNSLLQISSQLFPGVASIQARLLSYRPLRRAIMELSVDDRKFFVRILKPSRIRQAVENHRLVQKAGIPTPEIAWWSDNGVMVISGAEGASAHEVIDKGNEARIFGIWLETRARVKKVTCTLRKPSSLQGADWILLRLGELYPNLMDKLRNLEKNLSGARSAENEENSSVVRHGDLHFGQLILDPTDLQLQSLLDLDTLGIGDPADDFAALSSQLLRLGERHDWTAMVLASLNEVALSERLDRAVPPKTALQLAAMALSSESALSDQGPFLIEQALALSEL